MTHVSWMFQKNLKNRSSKHLRFMTGPGTKNIMRCVSETQLNAWAKRKVNGAEKELARRRNKRNKKENKNS